MSIKISKVCDVCKEEFPVKSDECRTKHVFHVLGTTEHWGEVCDVETTVICKKGKHICYACAIDQIKDNNCSSIK